MKRPINARTPESIYLEYFNDWLTVSRMAEYYSISEAKLMNMISAGRKAQEKQDQKHRAEIINKILTNESDGLNSLEHTPEDWQQAREQLEKRPTEELKDLLNTFDQ